RVILTEKLYYERIEKREKIERDAIAFISIEQLLPLPTEAMKKIIKKYKNADDVVWTQEEPRNMGAYAHIMMHFEKARNFRVCSRKMYAAPAAGSSVRSKARHAKVIESIFDKNME